MARLEDLTPGALVKGVLPDALVTVVAAQWFGSNALSLTYKQSSGTLGEQIVYREQEGQLEIATRGRQWGFDGDGGLFKLVAEAHRIRLAYLFDPLLAVHTSLVDPLPHQITAVYGEMLARQPLRFLLADDPGAGKTIMAGLLIKELRARGDLHRCLIVCPGSLVEQWQDELDQKFHLPFEILTNDKLEASRTGNWLAETPLVIARLDKLSRDEDLRARLDQTDWDLVVCDEAHKMSATYFGGEVKYTKRYRLGQQLSRLTRHFLLMSATPHNGKEEDFQLFLALLDEDRFEGRPRNAAAVADASDLMRRLVKEQLVKFDGRPLFPERRAYTVNYKLSDAEAALYQKVTEYVREQWSRADALEGENRRGTVGFALTTLQRRLASSPEAIFQSLRRRRERLEDRLREEQLLKRGRDAARADRLASEGPQLSAEQIDELEDAPDAEVEILEDQITDQATAARTISELDAEISTLRGLEAMALGVLRSSTDRKWTELSSLLQTDEHMRDASGHLRKLVIFTEHRDTLNYLLKKITGLLGREEAVRTIHGGMGRDERKKAENAFKNDRDVAVLLATDAAGEGINLQRAHLMVNYDLPWNPNRLEQRFGRIHRIGQMEVCHLWNLVAGETREGEVYKTLLKKLEEENEALRGQVFDVLGKLTFDNRPLRELLIEAVRYGDRADVRARLEREVAEALDREHLQTLVEERALVRDALDPAVVQRVRADMERAEARRLQPHFVASFFLAAIRQLGGTVHEREPKRYEVTHVPAAVRNRGRELGRGEPVLPRYERVTFDKSQLSVPGKPFAEFVCPGHPLLDATMDVLLERHRDLLKRGAVLVDRGDLGTTPRVLFFAENAVQDAGVDVRGQRRVVSRQVHFVEVDEQGQARAAGYAPYLDYDAPTDDERVAVETVLRAEWLASDLERRASEYVVGDVVPRHFGEVRERREQHVRRTLSAVRERLTREITYWDHRAQEIRAQEQAGKTPRLNSTKAQARADELQARLQKRTADLEQERRVSPMPPVVLGGALVLPQGLINRLLERATETDDRVARETTRIERLAMESVMAYERAVGNEPRDVSAEKCGYDVESREKGTGRLLFIEVKGRAKGGRVVGVTRNEILTALNKPDAFVLALVEIEGDAVSEPRYVRRPFHREPDFGVTSVNYTIDELLRRAESA